MAVKILKKSKTLLIMLILVIAFTDYTSSLKAAAAAPNFGINLASAVLFCFPTHIV